MSAPASASAPSASALAEQQTFLAGSPVASLSPLAQQLVADTHKLFIDTFGPADTASLSAALAPGRVNLIGEHTDYNDGFVMPLAIDRHTVVIGRRNGLQKFRIVSGNATAPAAADKEAAGDAMEDTASTAAPAAAASASASSAAAAPVIVELDTESMLAKYSSAVWHNYFRGVVAQFVANGHAVPFFDVAIKGNVPLGGGLSSSASLEVATASFLQAMLNLPLDGVQRALWCQKCEHEYCNVPCGVMDQFVSSLAEKDHVMLLDCRSFQPSLVSFTDPNVALLITNSHVPHGLGDGQYEIRVKECAAAVSVLQVKFPEVKKLRDATLDQLNAVEEMMDENAFYRARAAIQLSQNNYQRLGMLMTHSHVSMKNDYEISCDEIDCLVDIALELPGVFGSRMTGGGFGGCTVTLVNAADVQKVEEAIQAEYKERTGIEATTLITRPGPGATIVKL